MFRFLFERYITRTLRRGAILSELSSSLSSLFRIRNKSTGILVLVVMFISLFLHKGVAQAAKDQGWTEYKIETSLTPNPSDVPPGLPIPNSPADNDSDVSLSPNLSVYVQDADGDPLKVKLYGQALTPVAAGPDFTWVVLPDTQNYTQNSSAAAIFTSQTQWIRDHKTSLNITFVSQVGDVVDTGTIASQYEYANTAISMIEPDMAFGVTPGNRDSPFVLFNQYFGYARFFNRDYFGGHFGLDNNNSFQLFSASGLDFIVINLDSNASSSTAEINWADGLLKTYNRRRGVVISHELLNAGTNPSFTSFGSDVYSKLKSNPNLFLMLCGHAGAGRRENTYNGLTVNTLMSDYAGQAQGDLRIMTFSPSKNQIDVKTYSPYTGQYTTGSVNQFILNYDMAGSGNSLETIATIENVASGTSISMPWPNRFAGTDYQWWVTVNDGSFTTTSPSWRFTTTTHPTALTLASFTGNAIIGGVDLRWETINEINLTGFNLYWSKTSDGEKVRINRDRILAQYPGQMHGADYYYGLSMSSGEDVYYWLELVGVDERREWGGPVLIQAGYWLHLPVLLHN